MRARITVIALLVAVCAIFGLSQSVAAPVPASSHAQSCDGKSVSFHRHRARAIIKIAFDVGRYPDRTPAKAGEKRSWRSHKLCIHISKVRTEIAKFQDHHAAKYEKAYQNNWCAPHPAPDGGGCWVIPETCVEAESGGSWTSHNPTSPARGPYQLNQHGEPWPVTTRSQAMEHHRIAAGLYASQGLGPWVAPEC